MWIPPDATHLSPSYEQLDINNELAKGGLHPIASGQGHAGAVLLNLPHHAFRGIRSNPPGRTLISSSPPINRTEVIIMTKPVLEAAAQAFVEATNDPPFLFDLEPSVGRKTVDEVQSPEIDVPGTDKTMITVPGGPSGSVSVSIFRPTDLAGRLPVIIFIHGAGWVFGNDHTHGRLARELAKGVGAAVVFPNYSLSPEARFPTATEENYAVAQWVMTGGADNDLDPGRVAVAGDSVGGDMAASLTITAKERGDVRLAAQVLFYPVTNAAFDTGSYEEFATGYFLRRDGMQWFWDQYTTDPAERSLPTASPLQASVEQLSGLPPALVITGEADVLRDEGEAYANHLRAAGVPVTATRYQGMIHDFVMLNPLRETNAAEAAITQAIDFLAKNLNTLS